MLVKIGLVLYRCFRRVLMFIFCVVVHVLCVYASKLLSVFFWLFWDKFWLFLVKTGWHSCCVVNKIRSCKPGCAPASPAAHLCSTALIRRDISEASFCSCKLLWRSDEFVLLPFFNTQPNFCSYELLCRSTEFIFLRYPNLERWWFIFSAMAHTIRGVRVEECTYYVNKLRQNVGLETWIWRQTVMS